MGLHRWQTMSDAKDKDREKSQEPEPEKEQVTLGVVWPDPLTAKNSQEEQKQYNSNKRD